MEGFMAMDDNKKGEVNFATYTFYVSHHFVCAFLKFYVVFYVIAFVITQI